MLLLVLLTIHLLLLLLLHLELLLHGELLVHLLLLSRIHHLHWLTHHAASVGVHLLHRLLVHNGLLLLTAVHVLSWLLLRYLLLLFRLLHGGSRLFSGRSFGRRLSRFCILLSRWLFSGR